MDWFRDLLHTNP
jgi:hypothetical protein